ncbi:MAG: hypothetical protein RL726_201, partial [Actinomycetota bacterium]
MSFLRRLARITVASIVMIPVLLVFAPT